jgi:hypothetical protein
MAAADVSAGWKGSYDLLLRLLTQCHRQIQRISIPTELLKSIMI